MKRAVTILVGGVLVAGAAYCLVYILGTAPHREILASQTPELRWLKKEFNLNEGEFARLTHLHEGYLPECERRCRLIEEQNQKLGQLLANTTNVTPEIQGVLIERARLRAECQAAMLGHFFEVSRLMPAEQGKRYLAWVQEQTCLRDQAMPHERMSHGKTDADNHHE